jgi:hypothetical protein
VLTLLLPVAFFNGRQLVVPVADMQVFLDRDCDRHRFALYNLRRDEELTRRARRPKRATFSHRDEEVISLEMAPQRIYPEPRARYKRVQPLAAEQMRRAEDASKDSVF